MKRLLITFLCTAMLLSLAACTAAPLEETPVPTPEATPEPTPSPTPEPTSTPEPTLSPEEIEAAKNMEEFMDLKHFIEKYNDEFAPYLIRRMYEEGKITEELYLSVYRVFDDIRYREDCEVEAELEFYQRESKIVNGEHEKYDEYDISSFLTRVSALSMDAIANISLFNNKDRKIAVKGLELIDKWYANPTKVNREAIEDMYFSEDLNPAIIIQLDGWLWGDFEKRENITVDVDGEKYNLASYLTTARLVRFNDTIGRRFIRAANELIRRNNTPNSEKDWLTESEEN